MLCCFSFRAMREIGKEFEHSRHSLSDGLIFIVMLVISCNLPSDSFVTCQAQCHQFSLNTAIHSGGAFSFVSSEMTARCPAIKIEFICMLNGEDSQVLTQLT